MREYEIPRVLEAIIQEITKLIHEVVGNEELGIVLAIAPTEGVNKSFIYGSTISPSSTQDVVSRLNETLLVGDNDSIGETIGEA